MSGRVTRFAALVVLLATLAGVLVTVGVPSPGEVAAAIGGSGVAAPVLAVVGFAVLVLGLVPRTLLAAAAGLLFGPLAGAGYILTGATLGALVAFWVGRWLGREFIAAQHRLAGLDGWLSQRGITAVVTVRVLPVAPFGLVSYAFGTSGVRLGTYLVGTVLGMLPATAVYVNLGAAATRPGSTGFWVAVAAAVALWLVTTTVIGLLERRRRLRQRSASHIPGAISG